MIRAHDHKFDNSVTRFLIFLGVHLSEYFVYERVYHSDHRVKGLPCFYSDYSGALFWTRTVLRFSLDVIFLHLWI